MKYYEYNSPNISAKLRLIHAKQVVHQRRSLYILISKAHQIWVYNNFTLRYHS